MRLVRLALVGALTASIAGGLSAQIPTRKAPVGAAAPNAARLLVANPHTFNPQDSAASVAIGNGLRLRIDKLVNGNYAVLTRAQMNEALKQFGYPADAILAAPVQKTFATSLQAKVLVGSMLAKDQSGRYTVTSRLAGLNDDAGVVVVVAQGPGQKEEDLGTAVAEGLEGAIKTLADARACPDQRKSAPDKAIASAKKAVAIVPKHGLAHLCLAEMALEKGTKKDSAEAMDHLRDAVVGDPLSLKAWTDLASGYEVAGDTAKTVDALKQMLLVAPTNQPLREQAFKLFIRYERPDAAEQAALDGLKIDPTNSDLWDLLSNARVFKGDFAGAVDALEQVVANDSTKADSAFFLKITVMASQKPDTSRLLKWAQAGSKKFPDNVTLLNQLVTAYQLTGPVDSIAASTKRLMAKDTTAVAQALTAAQALITANRAPEAQPYLDFVSKYGDAQAKEGVAGLLFNAARPLLQPPQDWPQAATKLRQVVALANPQGRIAPLANYYLGLSILQQIPPLDAEAEKQKSCDMAKQEAAMAAEAEAAFTKAPAEQAGQIASFTKYLEGLKPRVASMQKVYCK
jgi:tetratricopeptide (TPR) repeat protein